MKLLRLSIDTNIPSKASFRMARCNFRHASFFKVENSIVMLIVTDQKMASWVSWKSYQFQIEKNGTSPLVVGETVHRHDLFKWWPGSHHNNSPLLHFSIMIRSSTCLCRDYIRRHSLWIFIGIMSAFESGICSPAELFAGWKYRTRRLVTHTLIKLMNKKCSQCFVLDVWLSQVL